MGRYKEQFSTKIRRIPLLIPLCTMLISIYGFILLYSAAGGNLEPWAYKQIIAFVVFFPITFIIALIDLRVIYNLSYISYIVALVLVIFVFFAGKSAMGATRWLDIGIFTIQPSEVLKISLVLMIAKFFHERTIYNVSDLTLIFPLIASILPIALVIRQPDLGTGLISIMVVCTLFFAAGVKRIYFISSAVGAILCAPVIWFLLYDYQKNRILTFLDPEKDPLGNGYNIIQSKIAIGSGGLFGKGLLSGTQGPLSFLPEYETDFIFSFLMEELGFVGGIVLLILYFLIIYNSLALSMTCRSKFTRLLVIGVTSLFFFHVFINMAMVMGLLPAVGVPLPLISYGRTMMVTTLIGIGLIMNAAINQHKNI